ncbi:MAG: Fe-S cluster assembly protein SufD [Rikenellaceae bacterium]
MGELEKYFAQTYLEQSSEIGEKFPLWFNSMRRSSADYLSLIDTPAKKDYLSDLSELITLGKASQNVQLQEVDFPFDSVRLSMTNGVIDPSLTDCDNNLVYGALSVACVDYESEVKAYFNSVSEDKSNYISALTSAFMREGAFILVKKDAKIEKPIVIDNFYTNSNENNFARTLIIVESGAEVDIIVRHFIAGGFSAHTRELIVNEGAKVNLTEYVDSCSDGVLMQSNHSSQKQESENNVVFINSGAKYLSLDYSVQLLEKQANSTIKGLYLVGENQKSVVNVNMNHLEIDCKSDELIKGLAAKNGIGSFAGRIYVAPKAQRTSASQQSRNIMLSEKAKIYTKPQLEIYADDVKCNHGATIGQMNDEAIYYMRQRGISELDARKLQLSGFVNDIVSNIKQEELAAYFYQNIAVKIDEL